METHHCKMIDGPLLGQYWFIEDNELAFVHPMKREWRQDPNIPEWMKYTRTSEDEFTFDGIFLNFHCITSDINP